MEIKDLHNFTITQLKEELPSSRCLWMGDDFGLVDVRYKDGVHMFWHPCRLEAHMAMFCLKGNIRLTVNLNEFQMSENTLFLSTPGNIIKVNEILGTEEDIHFAGIIMSKEFVHSLRVDVNKMFNEGVTMIGNPCLNLSEEESSIVSSYIKIMGKLMTLQSSYMVDSVSSIISSLFYLLAGVHSRNLKAMNAAVPASTSRGRQVFDQFIRLVSENYCKYRNVGFYADSLCLTPKYLSKLIKAATGRSAPEWIDAYVILEAKNLLKYSSSTIKEIVYKLNFPNQSVFYKFFKARTGMTPSEYRNS